ncbi:MAG: hypothetical protein WA990_10130 [Rubrobacteraceae bacterium]
MGRGRDRDSERPVEPEGARRSGNDPDAVRIEDEGGSSSRRSEDRRRELGPDIHDDGRRVETGSRTESRGARRVSEDHEDRDLGRGGSNDGSDSLARRDSARWGPIWAGLIAALTTFLLLQLLAIGIGIVGIGPNNTGGAWVSAILGLIAFFIGGAVAGMTSSVRGPVPGLINGFLVWALGTVLILLLSALGLGQIFGALGSVVGQVGVLQNIQQGGVNAPNVDPAQIASDVRAGALGAFFGLLLTAVASMIGGLLGGSPKEPVGHMARDRNS